MKKLHLLFCVWSQKADRFTVHQSIRKTRVNQHFCELVRADGGEVLPNYRNCNYLLFTLFCQAPRGWNTTIAPCIPNLHDIPASKGLFNKCIKLIFIESYNKSQLLGLLFPSLIIFCLRFLSICPKSTLYHCLIPLDFCIAWQAWVSIASFTLLCYCLSYFIMHFYISSLIHHVDFLDDSNW